jgi:hypothetical protein
MRHKVALHAFAVRMLGVMHDVSECQRANLIA